MQKNKKIVEIPAIVIYGPTSSGKSDLAVFLAKHLNGEVISADSRQVYKGVNIASGKVTKKEMQNIPHHLLDVISPKTRSFSAWEFREKAKKAALKIWQKGKLPIVAGGTMFYISALLDEVELPAVPANPELRKKLEKLPFEKLISKLEKLNPQRAKKIEPNNSRRAIRAIEIELNKKNKLEDKVSHIKIIPLKLGIDMPKDLLKERITQRVHKRLRAGMVAEAKRLHQQGLTYKRMRELGLELEHLADYLQGKITKQELASKIASDAWRYAKRQLAWWTKDKDIVWIPYNEKEKFLETAKNLIEKLKRPKQ